MAEDKFPVPGADAYPVHNPAAAAKSKAKVMADFRAGRAPRFLYDEVMQKANSVLNRKTAAER